MNWVVVGQGAIGLLWYHHLNQLPKKHTINETNSAHEAHDINGINALHLLASTTHDVSLNTYQFTSLTQQVSNGIVNYCQSTHLSSADAIILCVKSYQITGVIKQIAPYLHNNCQIILAHNGMGTLSELSDTFVNNHSIYAMLLTHGCLRTSLLKITHTGAGHASIGLLAGKQNYIKQQALLSVLNKALPQVYYESNIAKKQWEKLAINCVINPITALHNIDNGAVANVEFEQQVAALVSEIIVIANTQGVIFKQEELVWSIYKVAKLTAKNCSSMRCDILAQQKTEVDYINGYIHRLGEEYALATPENTQLWQAIKALEANALIDCN